MFHPKAATVATQGHTKATAFAFSGNEPESGWRCPKAAQEFAHQPFAVATNI
jgi:hypothetical protein